MYRCSDPAVSHTCLIGRSFSSYEHVFLSLVAIATLARLLIASHEDVEAGRHCIILRAPCLSFLSRFQADSNISVREVHTVHDAYSTAIAVASATTAQKGSILNAPLDHLWAHEL